MIPLAQLSLVKKAPMPKLTREDLPCAPVRGLTEEWLLVTAADVDKLPGDIAEEDKATLRAAFREGARVLRVVPG